MATSAFISTSYEDGRADHRHFLEHEFETLQRRVFDTIPTWAATTTRGHRSASGYRLPAQPWGTGRAGLVRLLRRVGIERRLLPVPPGGGLVWGRLYPRLLRALPGVGPMAVVVDLTG